VNDDPPDLDRLGQLGRVDPPAPGVLDAAREVLWSAVAAEMLATAPPDAAHPGAAHPGAARAAGEPAVGRNAEEAPGPPRHPDPGEPRRNDPGAP
jgi:hypothetical protein